jgi:hypothetical protein
MFYGWLITGLAILAIVYSSPGESFGLIVFAKYFKSGLNIGQSQIDRIYLISTLSLASFLCLWAMSSTNVGSASSFLLSSLRLGWLPFS